MTGTRHCGRPGCQCTHEDPCLKGWRDYDDQGRGFTAPCKTCRYELWMITTQAPSREAMQTRMQDPQRRRKDPYGGT